MTAIQLLALFGVFVIGAIGGGYAMFKFLAYALKHSTIVGMQLVESEDMRLRMRLTFFNASASFGASAVDTLVSPEVASALQISVAQMAPPEVPAGKLEREQHEAWQEIARTMPSVVLEAAFSEINREREVRAAALGDTSGGRR